jgi:tetratricopeptide (TPR) repeat protein
VEAQYNLDALSASIPRSISDEVLKIARKYLFNGGNPAILDAELQADLKRVYSASAQLKPDDADAYYNRGVAKGAKGDLDGAIADYSKAIELKPDYAEPYNNRGIVKGAKEDRWHLQFDSTSAARLLWLVTATLAELALELELASSRALAPART